MLRATISSIAAMLFFCCQAAGSDIRRVVTGIDASNKSIAMFDGRLALTPVPGGLSLAKLWVTDSYPLGFSFKSDTTDKSVGISPPANGTQLGVVEIPPPEPANAMQPPLWHRTRTVDYIVVISGEIDLMLDDSMVHLKAGDAVVQQATNHAWVNRGKEVCRLLVVLMDAKQP